MPGGPTRRGWRRSLPAALVAGLLALPGTVAGLTAAPPQAGAAGLPYDPGEQLPLPLGGSSATKVGVGDLDGDGRSDVAVGLASAGVAVYRQRIDGGLDPATVVDATVTPTYLRVGDVSGDGLADVVVATSTGVRVELQSGGALVPQPDIAVAGITGLAIGDLNQDGRNDVLVTTTTGGKVLRQSLAGTLSLLGTNAFNDGSQTDPQLVDVDADGRLDVVTFAANKPQVRFQLATGNLALPVTLTAPGTVGSVAVGDLNGDGRLDLVVGSTSSWFAAAPQTAARVFGAFSASSTSTGCGTVRPADVDLDGDTDLVVGCSSSTTGFVVHRQAGGVLGPAETTTGSGLGAVAADLVVADVNSDGAADVVAAGAASGLATAYNTTTNAAPTVPLYSSTLTTYGGSPLALAGTATDTDPLTVELLAAPAHGTITGLATNAASPVTLPTYTATPGYVGTDSFTFGVTDGHRLVRRTVSLSVHATATLAGTVTDGYAPLTGAEVHLWSNGSELTSTATAADGTWSVPGLLPGGYKLFFHDPTGTDVDEWYQDKPDLASATVVYGNEGATTTANAALAPVAASSPIVVTTTADGGPGSLRQAAGWANANPDANTIVLAAGQTYPLTAGQGGELILTGGPVTILGNGATIQQTATKNRVISAAILTLDHVTVTGGQAWPKPTETSAAGGGVFATNVTLNGSIVTGNNAGDATSSFAMGGGVFAVHTFTSVDSTVTSNAAWGSNPRGGGVAGAQDGFTATRTTFTGNKTVGVGGQGGGIQAWTGTSISMEDSSIVGNSSDYGGGLYTTNPGAVTIRTSTFANNVATQGGGGYYGYALKRLDVDRSTFYLNNGGAITAATNYSTAPMNITGSTISNNGFSGQITANSFVALTVTGSVISGGTGCALYGATVTSGGGNYETDNTCSLSGATDRTNAADPQLDPLADNGGPTKTRLPGPTSALRSLLPVGSPGCPATPTTDQRGQPRPAGAGCEPGAVEVGDGSLSWLAVGGGSAGTAQRGSAVDSTGNSYVGGVFTGHLTFGTGSGAVTLTSAAKDGYVAKFGPDGSFQWARAIGGAGNDDEWALTVDANDRPVVGGSFVGSVDFGGGVQRTATGTNDAFVATLDPADGTTTSVIAMGGANGQVVMGVAVDATGDITATGMYAGSFTAGATTLAGAGNVDGFIARYHADGTAVWARRVAGPGPDLVRQAVVDANGEITVTGAMSAGADLCGAVPANAGSYDAFVAHLDSSGACLWTRGITSAGMDLGWDVALDAAGNVYASGIGFATTTVGTEAAPATLVTGGSGAYLASYTPAGALRFLTAATGPGLNLGVSVAVTPAGDRVYLSGSHNGTTTFGSGATAAVRTSPGPTSEQFTAAFTGTGAPRWVRTVTSTTDDIGASVHVAPSGDALTAGITNSPAQFGTDVTGQAATDPNGDVYVALLTW